MVYIIRYILIKMRKKIRILLCCLMVLCTVGLLIQMWWANAFNNAAITILDMDFVARLENNIFLMNIEREGGTGCEIPDLDPHDEEMMAALSTNGKMTIDCRGDEPDWIECNVTDCVITHEALNSYKAIRCSFREVYFDSDQQFKISEKVTFVDLPGVYRFNGSDHVEVNCTSNQSPAVWSGFKGGLRPLAPNISPPNNKETYNVMVVGIDSLSKNQFIREMPKSFEALNSLDAVILNGYNIVGDGTPAALFPILTGRTEVELPETRKKITNNTIDEKKFLFHHFKEDGYRTLYFEDMPQVGTFQWRFNGFKAPPADHYLGPLARAMRRRDSEEQFHCLGQEPSYSVMLNLTKEFFTLKGKKFSFTFIVHLNHEDKSFLNFADHDVARFIYSLRQDGILKNTLFILMGDHGRRYSKHRNTIQGKLEERLPLMSIILPDRFRKLRPRAEASLRENKNVLTTPFDIHSTILDVVGLDHLKNNVTLRGSKLPRAISMLKLIPKSRSCGEAAVLPHWCTCLRWNKLPISHRLFKKAGKDLLHFINHFTEEERPICAKRTLTSIEWVQRRRHKKELLHYKQSLDDDGLLWMFDNVPTPLMDHELYQVRIVTQPGYGVYEATLLYQPSKNRFTIDESAVSRTSMYSYSHDNEAFCIHESKPHLAKYCFCQPSEEEKNENLVPQLQSFVSWFTNR